MSNLILYIALGLALLAGCSTPAKAPESKVLFVHCGHLIDGFTEHPLETVDLIAVDGKITQIAPRLERPPGSIFLDLSDYTVLPGLIDMHTHLTADPSDESDLVAHMRMTPDQIEERARKNARTMLMEGFTSVRDVGSYHAWSAKHLEDEINRGEVLGPRMEEAPFFLTIPGGGGEVVPKDYHGKIPSDVRVGVARGPEQFRAKAEEAVKGGADLLKVIASGAVLADQGTPGAPEMTFDEIKAVVDVAHAHGLKVAAHAHGAQSIKDAIRAGCDTIEHASFIDEEGIRLARAHHVALSMDIYNGDFIDVEGKRLHWPEKFLRKNLAVTERQRQSFTKALKAGVQMVYGTDAGIYPWGQNTRQFAVMVARGMSPMEAIRSATSTAASYMGWGTKVGRLAPGFNADLIAVKGDPLTNIRTLEDVRFVVKAGQLVEGSADLSANSLRTK